MDDAYKEVYFHEYCKKCKHEKNAENEEPCFECLNEPGKFAFSQNLSIGRQKRNDVGRGDSGV